MTLVTSGGWLSEAQKRKAKRDEVRERFRGKIGIKPLKSQDHLSLSPSAQLSVVQGLIGKGNPQGSADIEHGLAALSQALSSTGLAAGGWMAGEGKTALDFISLTPLKLGAGHFGIDEDG